MKIASRLIGRIGGSLFRQSRLDAIQESLGRIEATLNATRSGISPREHEFKVYSQWGEDGIIDHLVGRVAIRNRTFIEFGVENYTEANTLFLLKHRFWKGLVIDGSRENIEAIKRRAEYWRYDLFAAAAFITRDNINDVITGCGIAGDIGLLSVDIDGNDYWVWESIDCVSPVIVVAEYNSLFGPTAPVSIPYHADFSRRSADAPSTYYGTSIAALSHLARRKGYSLVSGNSAGNNAFFVRNDSLGSLKALAPEEAYVQAGFRESISSDGEVLGLNFAERQAGIANKPLTNVVDGKSTRLADFL